MELKVVGKTYKDRNSNYPTKSSVRKKNKPMDRYDKIYADDPNDFKSVTRSMEGRVDFGDDDDDDLDLD